MNHQTSFEDELREKLSAAADLMPLEISANNSGRHQISRSGRSRVVWLAAAAASVVALVGVVAIAPNSDSTADTAAKSENLDATLVVFTYPKSDDPGLAGDWAEIHTDTEGWQANGPDFSKSSDALRATNADGTPSSLAAEFALAGQVAQRDPARILDDFAQLWSGAPLSSLADNAGPSFDGNTQATYVFDKLTSLIATGRAGPDGAAGVAELLATMPNITVTSNPDGTVSLTNQVESTMVLEHLNGATFTYDPTTGHPVRMTSASGPTYWIEYTSVTDINAADYLARPNPNGTTPVPTTEFQPSEPSTIEGP